MKLTDVTALARPIDPRYPTNLAISVVSLLVAAGGTIYRVVLDEAWIDAIVWGAGAAFSVFLAWALARELDPDHDLAAFVAAALALIGLVAFGQPALLPVLWLLLLLRVVNRTVGVPARPLDTVAVLGLAGWLAWQGMWVTLLVTAAGFVLDAVLPNPVRRHLALGGLALAGAVAVAVLRDVPSGEPPVPLIRAGLAITAILMVVVIRTARPVTSKGDVTGERLSSLRVQAAQALALLAGLLWQWQSGQADVVALPPVWAAMLAVGLWHVGVFLVGRLGRSGKEKLD